MRAVLGIKVREGHDAGAALVYEMDRVLRCVAVSEERLSRLKHDAAFPARSINACLEHAGLTLADVDLVCMDKLGPGTDTSTATHRSAAEIPARAFSPEEQTLIGHLGERRVLVVNHHRAHAASAFAVGTMPDAAVLVVDGSGTRFPLGPGEQGLIAMGADDAPAGFPMRHYGRSAETQSIFFATRDAHGRPRYALVGASRRSGAGHFYTYFSRHVLGFGPGQEGKAMGLAAYGDGPDHLPRFPADLYDGADTALLDHCMKIGFRPRTRPARTDPTDPEYATIARWMQDTLSSGVLHLAREALRRTGSRRLCMAGGVALNVVANRLVRDTLMDEGLLDEMFVQPASSDAGTPLGAALVGYSSVLGGECPFQDELVYLGPRHREPTKDIRTRGGVIATDLPRRVADLLLAGRIVGWWQGRSEYGPRALGARSILCWARPAWMKDHLNARVKHREMFRPFAPIIAEEHASEVFDCSFPVPYMLMNTSVRPAYRDRLPAVTHADGSGRLQTVSRARTPRLHALLEEVRRRDGVGVLLNTSFNVAGEPIVETASDALACYDSTAIDALVIEDTVLEKPVALCRLPRGRARTTGADLDGRQSLA